MKINPEHIPALVKACRDMLKEVRHADGLLAHQYRERDQAVEHLRIIRLTDDLESAIYNATKESPTGVEIDHMPDAVDIQKAIKRGVMYGKKT